MIEIKYHSFEVLREKTGAFVHYKVLFEKKIS